MSQNKILAELLDSTFYCQEIYFFNRMDPFETLKIHIARHFLKHPNLKIYFKNKIKKVIGIKKIKLYKSKFKKLGNLVRNQLRKQV